MIFFIDVTSTGSGLDRRRCVPCHRLTRKFNIASTLEDLALVVVWVAAWPVVIHGKLEADRDRPRTSLTRADSSLRCDTHQG
jgi:hypothetical protein